MPFLVSIGAAARVGSTVACTPNEKSVEIVARHFATIARQTAAKRERPFAQTAWKNTDPLVAYAGRSYNTHIVANTDTSQPLYLAAVKTRFFLFDGGLTTAKDFG